MGKLSSPKTQLDKQVPFSDIEAMSFLQFMSGAILISLSGVIAPGALTALTVGNGSRDPRAGMLIAIGHGIVEFPLMIAVLFGFGYLMHYPLVKPAIGLFGGLFLLYMGVSMLRTAWNGVELEENVRTPVLGGIVLSIGNPYFLLWWGTIGATLITQSTQFGAGGIALFMVAHWFCDFVWLALLAFLAYRGQRLVGSNFQRWVFAVSGVFLLFFGGSFIYRAIFS